ncbi:hypothetical protein A6J39_015775 [Legionella anisa]|uniref:Uncharacterized protein n=1 Tax=Legionella anisa TaxID=28082 RepID=A0AAX0WWX8_9GAMM|nr:hypothetical protein DLD14_06585 [Legionella anisa]PNL62545.1 hypothetical protein A6J39_015775 [Legionella anisa]
MSLKNKFFAHCAKNNEDILTCRVQAPQESSSGAVWLRLLGNIWQVPIAVKQCFILLNSQVTLSSPRMRGSIFILALCANMDGFLPSQE